MHRIWEKSLLPVTAQALLELNREDGGNRRFICIQFPEPPTNSEARKAGFSTIAEIGKERIRRVIIKMQQTTEGMLVAPEGKEPEDLGFRIYKLGLSNFKA